jgi:2-polyprenyl-3-methyl-5-hydroxy-6-metoxy-1,4-benzoquinol methylase
MKKQSSNSVYNFFNDNSESWILNGYNNDGYNYPVAAHRLRIIKKFIQNNFSNKKIEIIDIGCGGGQVTMELAKLGHNVIGIDQSENMVKVANLYRNKFGRKARDCSSFQIGSISKNQIHKSKFDLCIAMGVIGYLASDKTIFQLSKKLLKPRGVFLVSCRNRLFNMQSLSFRTLNEIKKKNSTSIISEISKLYSNVPVEISNEIIKKFKYVTKKMKYAKDIKSIEKLSPAHKNLDKKNYKPFYEPRQHTPNEIKLSAKKYGFKLKSFHGVHPHLIDPNTNKLLPPQVFNKLSDCLQPLEDHPVSLVLSSVFIGAFSKK